MVFPSYLFLFYFLPLVLVSYYALHGLSRGLGWRQRRTSLALNTLLVLAGYVFYGLWNPWYVPLIVGMTVASYAGGRIIGRPDGNPGLRRCALAGAVVGSLVTLGALKYLWFSGHDNNLTPAWLGAGTSHEPGIVVPLGLSVSALQAISYTIDVYRGTAPPADSFIDLACYLAFFPQLVAGPIVRYQTVFQQLMCRFHTWERFASGVTLFILGFAKKVLLASPMAQVADAAFSAQSLSAPDAWFGVFAFSLQVYFDFSGYFDMASGLGRMIGFELPKNFGSPYKAESLAEFWRRWNITLSSFLRHYFYLPLGGNREGPLRTYLNLIIVMVLVGLWYGSNWMALAWGAYHGILLALERLSERRAAHRNRPRVIGVAASFVVVSTSWVLFRSPNLQGALAYFGVMIGQGGRGTGMLLIPAVLYAPPTLIIMAIAALVVAWPIQAHDWSREITWRKAVLVHPLFCVSILAMFAQPLSSFLDFRF